MHTKYIVISLFGLSLSCQDSDPEHEAHAEKEHSTLRSLQENHTLVYGIDVSRHQKEIDWTKVRTYKEHPIQFVYMKATEGSDFPDKKYAYNLEEARKNGFMVGSYHYFRTTSTPEAQFKYFAQQVPKEKQDLIPMVDIEERKNWDSETFCKNLKIFLDKIESHYGQKPMLYSVQNFYNDNAARCVPEYKAFIGRYSDKSPQLNQNKPWTVWQFTDKARIEGISEPVDIDILNPSATLDELRLKKK